MLWRKGWKAGRSEVTRLFDEIFSTHYAAWNAREAVYAEMRIHRFYCLHCGLKFALDHYEEELECPSCTSHYLIKQAMRGFRKVE